MKLDYLSLGHFSLATNILIFLNRSGPIPRKNLATPFSGYHYRYYCSTVTQLLTEGYLEITRHHKINHIQISDFGKQELTTVTDLYQYPLESVPAAYNKQQEIRQQRISDINGLCSSNGIGTTPDLKPDLSRLFSKDYSDEELDFFEECFRYGVFYSAREIRKAYTEILGSNEIANWTRLIGIVLKSSHIPEEKGTFRFIYSISSTLIKWMPSCEERTVANISAFLRTSSIITQYISIENHPSCIVCGDSYTMLPKLVFGRKHGQFNSDPHIDKLNATQARNLINCHNLNKVFQCAYYVTPSKQSRLEFFYAVKLNNNFKTIVNDTWFQSEDCVKITTLAYQQRFNSKSERVIYMPCIDLIELAYYRYQGRPCHMIIPKGSQEGVSRVLGPLLLSATDHISREALPYNLYDESGQKLDLLEETLDEH